MHTAPEHVVEILAVGEALGTGMGAIAKMTSGGGVEPWVWSS